MAPPGVDPWRRFKKEKKPAADCSLRLSDVVVAFEEALLVLLPRPRTTTSNHVLPLSFIPVPLLLLSRGPARGGALPEARGCPCTMDHAGGDGVPWPAAGRRAIFWIFWDFLLVFMGIRRTWAMRPCYHASCDILSALLTVPCCTIDHLHRKKERKKTARPREGWEDGTPPPHRDFEERCVMR